MERNAFPASKSWLLFLTLLPLVQAPESQAAPAALTWVQCSQGEPSPEARPTGCPGESREYNVTGIQMPASSGAMRFQVVRHSDRGEEMREFGLVVPQGLAQTFRTALLANRPLTLISSSASLQNHQDVLLRSGESGRIVPLSTLLGNPESIHQLVRVLHEKLREVQVPAESVRSDRQDKPGPLPQTALPPTPAPDQDAQAPSAE